MKKIKFIPSSEIHYLTVDTPFPAKKSIPEWYKNIKPINKNNIKFNYEKNIINTNIKSCIPFFDSLSCGYIQSLWCDVLIENINNNIGFKFSVQPDPIKLRGRPNIPIDNTYYPYEFSFIQPWIPKLPKGYSAIITSPLNRLDLPWNVLSGIVDYDIFYHVTHGNIPFYIKNNFTGLIPAGTPMYQIIPFKRDAWSHEKEKFNLSLSTKRNHYMLKNFIDVYKKNFWQKKYYD